MPSAAATRRATGEAGRRCRRRRGWPGAAGRRAARRLARLGADAARRRAGARPSPPAAHAADRLADGDRLAAAARISAIVPVTGAGSSMSTLSVESSTTVSPSSTVSPTCTAHSRIVPSWTDSPPAGVTMSTSVCGGSAARAGTAGGRRGDRRGRGALSPAGCGCAAVAAGLRRPVRRRDLGEHRADRDRLALGGEDLHERPGGGRGTSASTLSVETSTSGSSASTASPSCLCHSRTVPSRTDSPIAGSVT